MKIRKIHHEFPSQINLRKVNDLLPGDPCCYNCVGMGYKYDDNNRTHKWCKRHKFLIPNEGMVCNDFEKREMTEWEQKAIEKARAKAMGTDKT